MPCADSVLKNNIIYDEGFGRLSPQDLPQASPMREREEHRSLEPAADLTACAIILALMR